MIDWGLRASERFGAVGGGPLASSITLAAFPSLFPLLLVGIAVVGFLSSGDDALAADLVADIGLQGRAAEVVTDAVAAAEGSRQAASVLGLAGLLWSGLGVVGALQQAINATWQETGRGLRDRLVALRWIAGAAVAACGCRARWLRPRRCTDRSASCSRCWRGSPCTGAWSCTAPS